MNYKDLDEMGDEIENYPIGGHRKAAPADRAGAANELLVELRREYLIGNTDKWIGENMQRINAALNGSAA